MSVPRSDRYSRRRLLAAAAGATAVGLAGCSGGDGGGGSDGDSGNGGDGSGADGDTGGDGTATADTGADGADGTDGGSTDGSTGGGGQGSAPADFDHERHGLEPVDVPGEVTENAVDGLDAFASESYRAVDHRMAADGNLVVVVFVENTGDETVRPLDYGAHLRNYDGADEQLNDTTAGIANDLRIDPGGSGSFAVWGRQAPEAVARYECDYDCEGERVDGVYCE